MVTTAATPPTLPAPEAKSSGMNIKRMVMIGAAVLIGAILLVLLLGIALAASNNTAIATIVQIVRDIVIILLALEGVLIVLALAILILQVARLVNLLQTEVKPVLENAQETMKTAQGTMEFVTNNVAEPIIKASGFFAGASVVARNVFGIRRAIRRKPRSADFDVAKTRND
jgi:hypothetical protein